MNKVELRLRCEAIVKNEIEASEIEKVLAVQWLMMHDERPFTTNFLAESGFVFNDAPLQYEIEHAITYFPSTGEFYTLYGEVERVNPRPRNIGELRQLCDRLFIYLKPEGAK